MILSDTEDTIVALATPVGEGAIAVIRLSGPQAFAIAEKIFKGKTPVSDQQSHTVQFGTVRDQYGKTIDEVLCTVFRAPHSYTGEDVVEISCHGGLLLTRRILDECLSLGARMAQPGEFTKRAFLNGKLDLSQAEAVADLIQARSEKAHKSSIDQLSGKLSKEIKSLRDELVESLRLLELELDFVEEDIEFADKSTIQKQIQQINEKIEELLKTFSIGKVYKEGIRVALIGEPNVGKSSLLNALLQQERAIVTHIPGTTRDFIEEALSIEGVLYRITDTAGIRETDDPVEKEGVRRTAEIVERADIVILIFDSTQLLNNTEYYLQYVKEKNPSAHIVIVYNKVDLLSNIRLDSLVKRKEECLAVSAKTGEGVEKVKEKLVSVVLAKEGNVPEASVIITNSRHVESLQKARQALIRALETMAKNVSNEFIAVDLRLALDYLGEIVGIVTTDDILNGIFSKFCIGK
ncbi:MAG: tRNA uridine-5-carboxymethylaminomethyl(34) synthesis GTPase MnmE [Bacteroidetes bacterium]|nr:tRNA uridine-5-carboxymethylaminomethyl(34) synthesis GTPase MnmE [Bacteroidota bacterium]